MEKQPKGVRFAREFANPNLQRDTELWLRVTKNLKKWLAIQEKPEPKKAEPA